MTNFKTNIIAISAFFIAVFVANAQDIRIPATDYLLDHATMGKEFYVAFPPNSMNDASLKYIGLDIIVTSTKNTTVKIEAIDQFMVTRQVEAYKPLLFSTSKKDFGTTVEVKESDEVTFKAIRVTADEPISVYVLSNRQYSAEGYIAIPVSSWGTNYIHCAYWDFWDKPSWQTGTPNGAGFIVMASEQTTRVNITLKGRGEGVASCLGSSQRNIGDSYSVTLNPGQTYMICGDGKTKGVFDISGTSITANKPIGVISFHSRTMIPTQCPNDRDNLIEMITPTNTWGKYFVTVQFDRSPGGGNSGQGDFFRVLAKEANTNVSCKYYDQKSGELQGNWPSSLKTEGSFNEFLQTTLQTTGNKAKSIYGVSVWEADKPIMLMQYAYSQPWDGDNNWSPLMVQICPIENFVRSAVFSTPTDDFDENVLTFFAIGNPNDKSHELLRSIYIDGNSFVEKYPQIFSGRIPGTDIFWVRVSLQNKGVFRIHSTKTKFWGYLNGFSAFNAFGYPIVMGANLLDKQDFSPPQFEITGSCGNYSVNVTEMNNTDNTDHGLSRILMYENSYNYKFEMLSPEKFKPEMKITSQKFNLTLIDPLKPAKAWFVASDRGGNINSDSLDYEPEALFFNQKSVDLGRLLIGNKIDSAFIIVNQGTKPIRINKLELKVAKVFKLDNVKLPHSINPGDTLKVKYSYTPTTEAVAENQFDMDSVFVNSDCIKYAVVLQGKGSLPHITLQNMNFGDLLVGKKVCYEEVSQTGFVIENPGTAELTVYDIKNVKPPFSITSPTEPSLPFKIAPGAKRAVRSLCFVPNDTIFYEQEIIVVSDAKDDSTLKLSGRGIPDQSSVPEILTDESIISVLPNPAKGDWAEIRIGYITVNKIELYDMQGLLVSEIASGLIPQSLEFNVSGYSSGVYYLKFHSVGRTYIKRFLVAR